jgi:putative GTP pyrophosphokinase
MSEHANPVDFGTEYDRRLPLYRSLREEALFVINEAIAKTQIKTHSVLGRVKARSSFLEKINRKEYPDPFASMPDLVGTRVVCLFRDDIPTLCDMVRSEFNVVAEENKIEEAGDDSFGYMSVHFECTLHDHYTGPRYDRLKGIRFEVQVRTILMDAWANVSHHLAYKGKASIPADLRKDFNALSALFYIADQQFQTFFDSVTASEQSIAQSIDKAPDSNLPINRASVKKLCAELFPDREHSGDADVSELVEEISAAGYTSLAQLRQAIESGLESAYAYEETNPPYKSTQYSDVGIVRAALSIIDHVYDDQVYGKNSHMDQYRL